MSVIATCEPAEIIQGETLEFTKYLADYPPSEYTLTYAFRGASKQDVTAVDDGTGYLVSQDTTTWTAGEYWYEGRVTKTGFSKVVVQGGLIVKVGLSTITATTYDNRTTAKKMLDAYESALLGRADQTAKETEINGRRIVHMTPAEMRQWRDYWRAEYLKEQRLERVKKGLSAGNTPKVIFKS